jgi:hypothetical protein
VWLCQTSALCADGGPFEDATLGGCPSQAPSQGSSCSTDGVGCGWNGRDGACEACFCQGGQWACSDCSDAGPPSEAGPTASCPPSPPFDKSPCSTIGAICGYGLNGCGGYQCQCDLAHGGADYWSCTETLCEGGPTAVDGGPPFDASFSVCPLEQPADGAICATSGTVCSYGFCPTNCLCENGTWACATRMPCSDDGA